MKIKFSSADAAKSDIDARNGEVAIAYGAVQNSDGTYRPDYDTKLMARAIDGYQPVFLHRLQDGVNIIYISGTQLAWVPYEDTASQSVAQPHIIGAIPTVNDITSKGDIIHLATEAGLYQLKWQTDHYGLLPPSPDYMTIEFGLQKVGHLSSPDMRRSNPMDVYREAIAMQVQSKGYFVQPFFVRYAYRLTDGTHIMPSAPALMLPTALPPVIEVTIESEDGVHKVVGVDLSHNNYFELRYRVCDDAQAEWADHIAAIDIYVSKPIDTYDPNSADDGYIGSFAQLTDTLDCGGVRGRHYPSRSSEGIFSGHYSLADDNYTDHYVDDMMDGRHIWCIAANPHMHDDILQIADYFLIASIPYSTLTRTADFKPLPIITSDFSAIFTHKRLDEMTLGSHTLIPTALRWLGNRLIMGMNAYRLLPPLPYRSCTAMCGQASESASADIDITVFVRVDGKVYTCPHRCSGTAMPINLSLGRYMFYPDPSAFKMIVKQDSICYELPMTPHPTLNGSYWWGGLNAEYLPDSIDAPELEYNDIVETSASIFTFHPDNVLAVDTSVCLGEGRVCALTGAVDPPAGSVFGRYPIYALCSSGVWMLEYDSSKVSISSATLISRDGCVSHRGITNVDNKVAYISQKGINLINGAKVENITLPILQQSFDIYRLPHIDTILRQWDAIGAEVTTPQLLKNKSLIYDQDTASLVICGAGDYSLSFCLESKAWSVNSLGLAGALLPESMGLACDSLGNIVKLTDPHRKKSMVIVSRPIKLDAELSKSGAASIVVLGEYAPDRVAVAAYGSNDLYEWVYIQSSGRGRIDNFNLQPYRYVRIVVLGRLSADEHIYGILLDK